MKVDGYGDLGRVLDPRDQLTQTVVRFVIGPDSKEIVFEELEILLAHAEANNLLITVITDPECTPEEHTVMVILSGIAMHLASFDAAMKAEKDVRAC